MSAFGVPGHRIQPDGRRVETAILREESFGETIPAEPRFVHNGWRNRRNVRNRNQLYARRSSGVVVGQQSSADQRQWEALIAITDVVAAGEQVVGIEAVIDFYDGAVHAIRKWAWRAPHCCRFRRPGSRCCWIGRLRPGIESPASLAITGLMRHAADVCGGRRQYPPLWERRPVLASSPFSRIAFIVNEEERLVLDDRSAQAIRQTGCCERDCCGSDPWLK